MYVCVWKLRGRRIVYYRLLLYCKDIVVLLCTALSRLEEENGDLSKIEVDKVFRLVGHVRSKVASDNAMPGWAVFFVEFLFDVVFLECLSGAFDGIGLHILGHVRILDNGLAIGHCGCVYLTDGFIVPM